MSDLRKAAEIALKYFEDAYGLEDAEVAIKEALRQALAQPKREWVGVTYDEVYEFVCTTDSYINLAKAIEAKLKEKNT